MNTVHRRFTLSRSYLDEATHCGWQATVTRSSLLAEFVEWFSRRNEALLLYGGAVRDFALKGPFTHARDLDFVLEDTMINEVADKFHSSIVGRNRFGGIRFDFDGISVDCWELSDTWAFREHALSLRSWRDLVRASVLDIDGIVLRIDCRANKLELECEPFSTAAASFNIGLCLPHTFDWTAAIFRALALSSRYHYGIAVELIKTLTTATCFRDELFTDFARRRFKADELSHFVRWSHYVLRCHSEVSGGRSSEIGAALDGLRTVWVNSNAFDHGGADRRPPTGVIGATKMSDCT